MRAIRRLDDESLPIAEVCRRVARYAEGIGLVRPSYVHVRRIVQSERERRADVRKLRADLLRGAIARPVPDFTDLAARYDEIRAMGRDRSSRGSRAVT